MQRRDLVPIFQTLGIPSTAISFAGLSGHWDPNDSDSYSGSGTTYNNLVTANGGLLIYNSPGFGNATPKRFAFDGVDDYMDSGLPYAANDLLIPLDQPYSISIWIKLGITYPSGTWSFDYPLFSVGDVTSNGLAVRYIGNGGGFAGADMRAYSVTIGGSAFNNGAIFYNRPVHNASITTNVLSSETTYGNWSGGGFIGLDMWHLLTVTYAVSSPTDKGIKIYINGSHIASYNDELEGYTDAPPVTSTLTIGRMLSSTVYSYSSPFSAGHILYHHKTLTHEEIRQNFMATHKLMSDRLYGSDYGITAP